MPFSLHKYIFLPLVHSTFTKQCALLPQNNSIKISPDFGFQNVPKILKNGWKIEMETNLNFWRRDPFWIVFQTLCIAYFDHPTRKKRESQSWQTTEVIARTSLDLLDIHMRRRKEWFLLGKRGEKYPNCFHFCQNPKKLDKSLTYYDWSDFVKSKKLIKCRADGKAPNLRLSSG